MYTKKRSKEDKEKEEEQEYSCLTASNTHIITNFNVT